MGPIDIRLATCLGRRWTGEVMRHAAAQRPGAWLTLISRQAASERFQALQVWGVILLSRGAKVDKKGGVHNVHTRGFGFGCTGIRLGRIGEVFAGVADFQGLAPGSSPTSGTCFPCSEAF